MSSISPGFQTDPNALIAGRGRMGPVAPRQTGPTYTPGTTPPPSSYSPTGPSQAPPSPQGPTYAPGTTPPPSSYGPTGPRTAPQPAAPPPPARNPFTPPPPVGPPVGLAPDGTPARPPLVTPGPSQGPGPSWGPGRPVNDPVPNPWNPPPTHGPPPVGGPGGFGPPPVGGPGGGPPPVGGWGGGGGGGGGGYRPRPPGPGGFPPPQLWQGLPQPGPQDNCGGVVFKPQQGRRPPSCPVDPDPKPIYDAIKAAICGAPEMAVVEAPYHKPPFRAFTVDRLQQVVVDTNTATGTAASHLAAVAIQTAEIGGLTGVTIPIATPATITSYATVFTYNNDRSEEIVFRGFGVTFPVPFAGRALRWRIRSGGVVVLDEEQVDFAPTGDLMDIAIVAQPFSQITVEVRNLDTSAPYFAQVRLSGWRFPILRADDSADSTLLRTDPAAGDCGTWSPGSPGT